MSELDAWKIRGGYPYQWHRWPDEKPETEGRYLVQERLDRGAEIHVGEYSLRHADDGWFWWDDWGDGIEVAAWMELPQGIYSDAEIEAAMLEARERLLRERGGRK